MKTPAIITLFAGVLLMGAPGATTAYADGASIRIVAPQVTRTATTQTSRQISSAASQATREAATR